MLQLGELERDLTVCLFGSLAETRTKRWPTMSELEIPNLYWFNAEEGIQRLRKIGMVKWIYHLRLTHSHCEGPEDITFTNTLSNKFERGPPSILKEFHECSSL